MEPLREQTRAAPRGRSVPPKVDSGTNRPSRVINKLILDLDVKGGPTSLTPCTRAGAKATRRPRSDLRSNPIAASDRMAELAGCVRMCGGGHNRSSFRKQHVDL